MKVLITGAGRGIGLELTKRFLQNTDCTVFALSRNVKELEKLREEYADRLHALSYDLSKLLENDNTVLEWVKKETSEIDILVNNAGQLIRNSFEKIEFEEFQQIFNVNFSAPALLIKLLMPLLKKAPCAHVTNITSMAGYQGSSKFPGLSYYGASKAALAALTEGLAAEYKDTGMKFNALALGAAQTKMLEKAFSGYKAPVTASQMAEFIYEFSVFQARFLNGKVIPVSLSTP